MSNHTTSPFASDRVKMARLQLGREELEPLISRMKERGIDVIDLGGYVVESPHGPVPPPQHVLDAVRHAMETGWQAPGLRGYSSLREVIAGLEKEKGIDVDPASEILVTSGGVMQGMFNMLLATINPGDEVLVFRPGLSFDEQVKLVGGVPVFVQLKEGEGYRFDAEEVERAMSPRTKVVILNTPHNPTGHVATMDELQRIAEVVQDHDVTVFSDEILWNWVYDGRRHISIASLPGMRDRTVIFSSVTKCGMYDWRIGWVTASAEMISQVEKIMFWQNEFSPPLCQIAAEAHLLRLKEWIRDIVPEEELHRDLMYDGLLKLGLKSFKAEGHLTMFPTISTYESSSIKFVKHLLETAHVLVAPGVRYHGESHLRVGFNRTTEEIRDAIDRMVVPLEKLAGRLSH